MKSYFYLQFRMNNRKLTAFGIPPLLAYPLLLVSFVALSLQLFSKIAFAEYLYSLLAFGWLTTLTNQKRNEFLKTCFTKKTFFAIRLVENGLVILPFIAFLIYQKEIIFSILLMVFALILSSIHTDGTLKVTIPTPFYKKPFEFVVGFRKTFFLIPIAYILCYISISVVNLNLGIFSILLLFFIVLSYYSNLENEFYIWSFHHSAKDFLFEKIKTGLWFTSYLILPIFINLSLFFSAEIELLLTFIILGYAYLICFILAKYATYPSEMNIPQGVLIAFSLLFPPLLMGIIPYFYFKSKKQLNTLLP